MKKLLLITVATVSLGTIAKPLQRQIAKLKKAASLYARNEVNSWKRISDLNRRLSYLEQRIREYQNEPLQPKNRKTLFQPKNAGAYETPIALPLYHY